MYRIGFLSNYAISEGAFLPTLYYLYGIISSSGPHGIKWYRSVLIDKYVLRKKGAGLSTNSRRRAIALLLVYLEAVRKVWIVGSSPTMTMK
jgi:hypothetical protein